MYQLSEGLIYSPDLNKLIYSNVFIVNSGLNLQTISEKLGDYAEYISEDDKDVLYARVSNIPIFEEIKKPFDYSLSYYIDIEKEIEMLLIQNPDFSRIIVEEYEYIKNAEHNMLLLRMAFILKKHLDKHSDGVYLMRGSGISSLIFYVIGINKVNPLIYGLDYKDFWK